MLSIGAGRASHPSMSEPGLQDFSDKHDRSRTIIGLDVGGTKTAVIEGTCDAEILQRREFPTNAHLPFEVTFPAIAAIIDQTIAQAVEAGRDVMALSVSIGGPLRIGEGVLIDPPHLPGWHHSRLKDRLTTRFPGLPVFIEH